MHSISKLETLQFRGHAYSAITDVATRYKFTSVNYALTYPGVSLPSDAGYKKSLPHNARDDICEPSSIDGVTGDKDGAHASGLMSVLSQQPLSVTIQAVQSSFRTLAQSLLIVETTWPWSSCSR